MKKRLFNFFYRQMTGLLVVSAMTGCAWFATKPAPVVEVTPIAVATPRSLPTPATPIALSADAVAALNAAEARIVDARKMRTLWPSAVVELDKARAAAKVFDSTRTIAFAQEVISLCEESLKQRQAPGVTP